MGIDTIRLKELLGDARAAAIGNLIPNLCRDELLVDFIFHPYAGLLVEEPTFVLAFAPTEKMAFLVCPGENVWALAEDLHGFGGTELVMLVEAAAPCLQHTIGVLD